MARPNHSRFVILGFLADRPRSGYDIRKAVEGSLGNFWNESFGQIYPALRDLEAEGLVLKVPGDGGGRERQAYTLTPPGRAALDAWLGTPASAHTYRVEALVKTFFGPLTGPAAVLGHVARFRAEHEALLAKYKDIGAHLEADHAGDPGLPYWKLTVDCGLKVGAAYLAWCDEAERVLKKL